MNNTRLKELIEKYLEGTATDEEKQEVEAWYQSFDSAQGLTEQMDEVQTAAFGQQLYDNINRDIGANLRPRPVRIRYMRWLAAAGIALLIGLATVWTLNKKAGLTDDKVIAEAANGRGAAKKVMLPDGSTLWLNASSSMRFEQAKQKGGKREVWLEGEGYFDVARQPDRPFVVHAGKVAVHVLGTQFNVDAYNAAARVAVTVAAGKVAVGNAQRQDNMLIADQQVVYNARTGSFATGGVAAKDLVAWTSGQLVFRKQSFRDIAERLERRYNASIRFENAAVAAGLLTASFEDNVPLEDVLAMLCRIYGYSFRKEGDAWLVLDNN